jgi:hypothetical protein
MLTLVVYTVNFVLERFKHCGHWDCTYQYLHVPVSLNKVRQLVTVHFCSSSLIKNVCTKGRGVVLGNEISSAQTSETWDLHATSHHSKHKRSAPLPWIQAAVTRWQQTTHITCFLFWKGGPSPWTATLTWWEGLCLFDVKKADQRQSEIK